MEVSGVSQSQRRYSSEFKERAVRMVRELRADELQAFRQSLQTLYESLHGEAALTSVEDWLSLHLTVASGGQVRARGYLRDRLGGGNVLTFELEGLDQSDLVSLIEALEEVEVLFPVVGSP